MPQQLMVQQSPPPLPTMTHSRLLKGPKCGPKEETTEEGVEARSLAHNTLRGRGACCSSGMGLGRIDKLHSLTRACTQPTQSGQCIVGAPLVLGRATGNTNTQDSPRPKLGGSHHLPSYSILYSSPRRLHLNGYFSRVSSWLVTQPLCLGREPKARVATQRFKHKSKKLPPHYS